MSLVSLQSKENQDKPYLFGTHFPQAIKIEPHSQVCVLKFLHYRDTTVYSITNSNNLLYFLIGVRTYDALRPVYLTTGEYSGDDLATELEAKLEASLQQFNYEFDVTFQKADPTASPPTDDIFTITYTSVPSPATTQSGIYSTSVINNINDQDYGAQTEALMTIGPSEADAKNRAVSTRGIITHEGQTILTGPTWSKDAWLSDTGTYIASFHPYSFGIVRDSLSKLNTENVNLDFNSLNATAGVQFDANGFLIYSTTGQFGTKLGSSGYLKQRPCRRFSDIVLQRAIADVDTFFKTKYKFIFTTVSQASNGIICQLEVSSDYGINYAAATPTQFGNDAQAKDYVKNLTIGGTTYNGVIWDSSDDDLNDVVGGVNQSIQNKLQTRFAPFKMFFENTSDDNSAVVSFDLSDTTWVGGDFTDYTGANDYDFIMTVAATPYYLRFVDPLNYSVSTTDTAVLTADGSVVITPADVGNSTVVWTDAGAGVTTITTTEDIVTEGKETTLKLAGKFNPRDDSVSLAVPSISDDIKVHKDFYDDSNEFFDSSLPAETTIVGADKSKRVSFLLSKLLTSDIINNAGSPLYLKSGEQSGTIGQTIGSLDRLIVNVASTGQTVFTSNTKPKKISKDTTLHISIPELSGVKSYEGGYNGVGKSIAQIPREEIVQNEDNGTLTYISPFENWIDINNGTELNINNFTTEVRRPDGSLADDLRPTTTLQVKFRENPEKKREQLIQQEYEKLTRTMSDAVMSGRQILSSDVTSLGS